MIDYIKFWIAKEIVTIATGLFMLLVGLAVMLWLALKCDRSIVVGDVV